MPHKESPFGRIDSRDIGKYGLDNGRISCSILDYGCTLQSLKALDRNGGMVDVVGKDGKTIGRRSGSSSRPKCHRTHPTTGMQNTAS